MVQPQNGREMYFVVMQNANSTRFTIHERYDLKGSTAGRFATEREKSNSESAILKDLDIKEGRLCVGPTVKKRIMEQLEKDTKVNRNLENNSKILLKQKKSFWLIIILWIILFLLAFTEIMFLDTTLQLLTQNLQ